MTFVANVDFLIAEINGRFVASVGEAEGVVFFDFPCGFGVEEFVAMFGGRQEFDAIEIDAEAIDRFHVDGIVSGSIVILFDPLRELLIEGFNG